MSTLGRIVSIAAMLIGLALAASAQAQDGAKLLPNEPDEPLAKELSLVKAAAFLDHQSLAWTQQRKCGTCHTNYPYLLARLLLKGNTTVLNTVRTFFEERVTHWDRGQKGDAPRWDTEVVATAATLALMDAPGGKLHPLFRQALDRMWTLQQTNGSWNWLKCNWPPSEHDDYYGAVYAALGVGAAAGE